MSLHFLVSISSDTENLNGVRFFSSFFQESEGCGLTLFHIARLDSSDSSAALMEMWKNPEEGVEGKLTTGAYKALNRARRHLRSDNIKVENMKTKTVQERYGKVRDILSEGSAGLYDAIILGRRATYALQWIFDRPGDEIPQAIIQESSLTCPLWVCTEPEEGRKNVLLCVDGSASSMRAVDHVGFVLSHVPQHRITVFQVSSSNNMNIQENFDETDKILAKHGINRERIQHREGSGLSVSGAILAEKNRGKYAAVAIGLEGNQEGGALGALGIKGGTAATLINKISKASLWICP